MEPITETPSYIGPGHVGEASLLLLLPESMDFAALRIFSGRLLVRETGGLVGSFGSCHIA